jgi:hypothetical protein
VLGIGLRFRNPAGFSILKVQREFTVVHPRPEAPMINTATQDQTLAHLLAAARKDYDRRRAERPDAEIELLVEEVEERVAPMLAANHNESLLIDG